MTKEQPISGDPNIVSMIELDLWLTRFEVQGAKVEDQYIIENITSKRGESLGARVARLIMSEWYEDDLGSFTELRSLPAAALLHIYGTQPLNAFLRAEQFIMNNRDNPPAPPLIKDEVDEIIDELLAPENEDEELHEQTEAYLEGNRDKSLLLTSKDPRIFIDKYVDNKIAFFVSTEQSGESETEAFDIKTIQRAFKFTKGRFRLLYDRAEELEKKK